VRSKNGKERLDSSPLNVDDWTVPAAPMKRYSAERSEIEPGRLSMLEMPSGYHDVVSANALQVSERRAVRMLDDRT
jgi:hypothetical protein